MTVYYRKRTDIPGLPNDIAKECIQIATNSINANLPMDLWYQKLELENIDSLSYTTFENNIENTGGVGLYRLPILLNERICDYYKKTNTELSTYVKFYIQVVTGGNFVAPHIDPGRVEGFIYLLQAGGQNVRTKWYTVKEEFKNLKKEESAAIPYHKLTEVENQCLEENMWHQLNFQEIHSVENQEYLRISLRGIESHE
jgi:hypothetical protein